MVAARSNNPFESYSRETPRGWHYDLGHRALRYPLFDDPDLFIAALEDRRLARELVDMAVGRVAGQHGLSAEEADAIAAQMTSHRHMYVDEDCIVTMLVVAMPPPQHAAECHFVAIAFTRDAEPHYFTLERSVEGASPMLCSWDAEERHSNHGAGPAPEGDSFATAVGRRLCSQHVWRG